MAATTIPEDLPESVREAIGSATVDDVRTDRRGLVTFDLRVRDGWPVRTLKVAPSNDPFAVLSEVDRLEWIDRRLPCPKVLASAPLPTGGHAVVLSLPPGTRADGPDHVMRATRTVEYLAQALRFVHEIPTDNCPFSARLDLRMRSIKRRIHIDRYDPTAFTPPYNRYTVQRLYEILEESRPSEDDDVFTHGSFGLRSALLDQTGVSGIVDWGLAGVADRYVDLAAAVRSIADALGPELIPAFFQAYGLERPDPRKLDFYALLAEFE
jgi:aminoglycoside phosphotransferase